MARFSFVAMGAVSMGCSRIEPHVPQPIAYLNLSDAERIGGVPMRLMRESADGSGRICVYKGDGPGKEYSVSLDFYYVPAERLSSAIKDLLMVYSKYGEIEEIQGLGEGGAMATDLDGKSVTVVGLKKNVRFEVVIHSDYVVGTATYKRIDREARDELVRVAKRIYTSL